jgi:hypothetical protein
MSISTTCEPAGRSPMRPGAPAAKPTSVMLFAALLLCAAVAGKPALGGTARGLRAYTAFHQGPEIYYNTTMALLYQINLGRIDDAL